MMLPPCSSDDAVSMLLAQRCQHAPGSTLPAYATH